MKHPKLAASDIYPDEAARRVAHIIGPMSAAALALAEAEDRRAKGEDAVILRRGERFLVGPRPAA